MQQQDRGSGGGGGDDQEMKQNQDRRGLKPPPVLQGTNSTGGGQINQQQQQPQPQKCPRCDSLNTKFCYYNNYSLSQPRYFCKTCRRYWTQGGTLRNVPVGGGCRKAKRAKTTTTTTTTSTAGVSSSQQNPSSSVLMSTVPALGSPIISSVGTYNPVGGGGGFLSSLAAIHQQSLSNQPSQLSFVSQAMTNFGVNLGSSNMGQVLLHGFPSQQQQRQDQFYNLGIRDDNTHRDHQHQFYPHDQESLIQSSTNLAANSQNWHQQAAFVSNSSTNPTDTTLWSTISTSVAGGHSTTTTTNALPAVYGGPSLNLDPWQHDHLSGYGPPS